MKRVFILVPLLLTFLLGTALSGAAQQAPPGEARQVAAKQSSGQPEVQGAAESSQHHESATEESTNDANSGVGAILEHSTEKAAHRAESWGKVFGISRDASYLISLLLNFAGIALLFYFLFRFKIPQMFRDRTASIQKAIRDAQAASADATQRLNSIEARLAKLDTEIAGIRSESEKQAVAEEERIRAAAEEDKRKVVESAKAEIDAISRNARRDLKSYAVSLAIDIAGKRIRVDERSDEALVRDFVEHLGKDGR